LGSETENRKPKTENQKPPFALLVPAAGFGTRMGGRKALLELAGKPILLHTLDRFLPFLPAHSSLLTPHSSLRPLCQTILVAHPDDLAPIEAKWGALLRETYRVTDIVAGGERRQDSVRAGLARLRPEAELVAIHDAVRPFVAPDVIAAALDAADALGAAIVAVPMKPTVKRVAHGRIVETVERADLWCAQTPQVFRRKLILAAYGHPEPAGEGPFQESPSRPEGDATDDAQLVERLGHPVAIVAGSELNLKITTPEDLRLAEAILAHGLAPLGKL
jgi:2-C-methyl-D-erythritol 4-phosphate cytidylyltransferase